MARKIPKYDYRSDQPFKSFNDLLRFTNQHTPLSEELEAGPREIKMVVWDADDTIWDVKPYGIASNCSPPYRKVSSDVVETNREHVTYKKVDGYEPERFVVPGEIHLKPGLRETLAKLEARNIKSSIASANSKRPVEEILQAFGLSDSFKPVKANWTQSKAEMISNISQETGIEPEQILFVDDSCAEVNDVYNYGPMALCMNKDIHKPEEVLKFIKE